MGLATAILLFIAVCGNHSIFMHLEIYYSIYLRISKIDQRSYTIFLFFADVRACKDHPLHQVSRLGSRTVPQENSEGMPLLAKPLTLEENNRHKTFEKKSQLSRSWHMKIKILWPTNQKSNEGGQHI